MFWKNSKNGVSGANTSPTIIAQDIRVLGNILSDGTVDFAGTVDGNVRAGSFTLRPQGVVNGEIAADIAHIYGRVNGMIRARHVHIYSSSHIEGVIMHESLSIEDGAYIDGKFKRMDKPMDKDISHAAVAMSMPLSSLDDGLEEMLPLVQPANSPAASQVSVMKKNIRLITQ